MRQAQESLNASKDFFFHAIFLLHYLSVTVSCTSGKTDQSRVVEGGTIVTPCRPSLLWLTLAKVGITLLCDRIK